MPNDVIWQPVDLITSAERHFRESLGLCLVLERIRRKVDAGAMDVSFHYDIDSADAIERDLFVLVLAVGRVANFNQVLAIGFVLFVALRENDVFADGFEEIARFGGLLPGVVID